MQSERTGIENKWFALTGRVVELKVEEDGDLHIALHDVTGDKPGVVVCEIPAKPQWCEIRTTVFSWTPTRFPFHTGTAKKLTFGQSPIITVIGKAFWNVGHAPKEQNNRRKYMLGILSAVRNLGATEPPEVEANGSAIDEPFASNAGVRDVENSRRLLTVRSIRLPVWPDGDAKDSADLRF
jgi:hypothetical protein